jgi:hypothetical protein
MPSVCKSCKHPAHRADCGVDDCGCVRYEPRQQRQRTWLVQVGFFEVNRWTADQELRVQASTSGGAALKAIRQVKHGRTSRRRILQTRVLVVPVAKSGSRS